MIPEKKQQGKSEQGTVPACGTAAPAAAAGFAQQAQLLDVWLDIAEAMLSDGAEVRRVEKALRRLGQSCGVRKMNAFTINSSINITCEFGDGNILTQTRRIESTPSNDLAALEAVNALSRRACAEQLSPEEIRAELKKIRSGSRNPLYIPSGILASGAFALFFGGTPAEALVSGLFGGLICILSRRIGPLLPNTVFFNYVVSFFTGALICLLCRVFPSLDPGRIMIGDIMLLVPGLAISGSIRDIMIGDTISGTMRFVESLVWALALALGFMTAMLTAGGLQ